MSDATDATAMVEAVLTRAGLPALPEERERLIGLYPNIAQWTGAVRVPEARYAEPALIYPATFER